MRTFERILTGIAVLVMPFIGLAATAHQMEQGSTGAAILYAAVSLLVFYELVRLSWHWHRDSRLHHFR